jgi:hypothetical protein
MRLLRLLPILTICGATELMATNLAPFIDLQEAGLTLATAGSGLAGGFVPTNLNVTVGGSVRFALLYWNGFNTACGACTITQPYGDQSVNFNGNPTVGTLIGNELAGGNQYVGYYADVTGIVAAAGPGAHSFSFADGNAANNLSTLNGVGLIAAFTNAADPNVYRVLVWDGLDFTSGSNTAAPVNFSQGADPNNRPAQLYIFAGGGTAAGTDQITVSNNPTLTNTLSGSAGSAWDSNSYGIQIPPGVGTTTVDVSGGTDAISWQVAMLRFGPAGPATGVPEPSTLVLLTTGVLAFSLRRRRS